MTRPIADWPTSADFPGTDRNFLPGLIPTEVTGSLGPNVVKDFAIPKLNKYRNKALIADLYMFQSAVRRRHGDGINVLNSNGAVVWFDMKKILRQPTTTPWNAWKAITGFGGFWYESAESLRLYRPATRSGATLTPESGTWVELDKI
jgi:hypothetical protein